MIKKLFILVIVFLLCIPTAKAIRCEGAQMKTYSSYLNPTNSDYVQVYEYSGNYLDLSYADIGNNSGGTGYWILKKFPSDFPYAGTTIDGYTVRSADVTGAIIRMVEVNKSSRGSSPLTAKISPVTGAWNANAQWSTIPTYNASVVDTYSTFGAIPSSSNYDTRYGYHSATYTYKSYNGPSSSGPWTLDFTDSISRSEYDMWVDTWGGTSKIVNMGSNWSKSVVSSTSAYYDYYYVYHDFNITNSIKYAIDHAGTGLLFYFDTSNTTFNRKIFTTHNETADSRRPEIVINFLEGSGNPPIYINNGGNKQAIAIKINTGASFKTGASMKINTGTSFKTIF